jgi:hypothetical protein
MTTRSMPQRGSANSELPDDDADLLGPVGAIGSTRSGAGRDEVGELGEDSDLIDDTDADLITPSSDAIGDSLPETDDDVVPEEGSLEESDAEVEPAIVGPEAKGPRPKAGTSSAGSRMPIFDPLHNIRECSKQLVLLEDHLEHPPKHCPDCIRKHLLTAEAFAEEAVSLDKVGRYQDVLGLIPDRVRALAGAYVAATPEQRHAVAQKVRVLRKELSKLGFDALPDGTDGSARAASGVRTKKEDVGDAGDPSAMGAEGDVRSTRKVALGRAVALVRDALAGQPGVLGVSSGPDCVVVRATPATAARLPGEALGWPIETVSGEAATRRAGSRGMSGTGRVRPGSWLGGGDTLTGKRVTKDEESVGAVASTSASTAPASAFTAWQVVSPTILERMTDEQQAFMDSVRSALPSYIPLRVNSSFRTPEEQAEAMRSKLDDGATLEDLRRLYGNGAAINEVLQFPASRWGGVISSQVARGIFLSRHLRHDALDLSVKLPADGSYMARAWQEAIVVAAKAAGAGVAFIEADPAHVHVERIGLPATDPSSEMTHTVREVGHDVMSWLPWVLVGAGVLAVAGFGLLGGGAALVGAGALFGFGSDANGSTR